VSEFDNLEGHDPKAEAEATGDQPKQEKSADKPAEKPTVSAAKKSDSKD